MLSRQQIESFKRDGFLLFRGLIPSTQASAWREEVMDYFGRPQSPDAWRQALQTYKADSFYLRNDPTPLSHGALRAIYADLHASAHWHGENELVMRPGNEASPWLGARAPHLDFPVYAPLRTLANSVLYLSDVEERGGAFMYWPGSHRVAWDYFRRNPGDYLSQGSRSQDQTFAILRQEVPGEPIEFTGAAGDVMIWHSLLLHSASVNTRAATRYAIFGRWGVPLNGEPIYDFEADIWSYWAFNAAAPASGLRQ